jgi:PQQ-dependent dehydrogenase (s-GDH family)
MKVSSVLCGAVIATAAATVATQNAASPERFTMRVVATGLEGPWEVTWGPDRQLWVTERTGKRVVRINPVSGAKSVALTVPDVYQSVTQDGLLGLALHPDFSFGMNSDYAFISYTYDDDPGPAVARRLGIRRYRFEPGTATLGTPIDILRGLPSHDDHVAGRLTIGPDRRLYLSIGDGGANFGQNRCIANLAQALPTAADVQSQNRSTYWGKVLRIELDGTIPANNPTIDGVRSHVFSYGHRNPLGLAFGPTGLLYESEHGPGSDDEVNLIQGGRNYGWPQVAGHRDDKAYVYSNWSASSPQPCGGLPRGDNTIPASVPSQTESSWNHALFTPPLQTFFTVGSAADIRGIGSATIAPGGLDVYFRDGVPGWQSSLLALSLIRGTVYRLPLAADGRSTTGTPIEMLQSANRYRDITVNADGRAFYLATDPSGPYRDAAGTVSQTLANPGSILEFRVLLN